MEDVCDPRAGDEAAHRITLPGGHWSLWRCLVLRGAGFPAETILGLSPASFAGLCDRVLELEERAERARRRAFSSLNEALDELRRTGCWEDRDRRKPLLKASRALSRGKLPRRVWHPATAALVDEWREAADELERCRAELPRAHAAAVDRSSRELARRAQWDRFREAVSWQNRRAVTTALDALARAAPDASRRSQRRQHEELVASYLQRYCVKNDTIGFFGPVGWARIVDSGPAVTIRASEEFLKRRQVYFENWAIDRIAARLAANEALQPWLRPRLRAGCRLEDNTLRRSFGASVTLVPVRARVVELCDGQRSARGIAEELMADADVPVRAEGQVYKILEALRAMGLVTWTLEVALALHPERQLRELAQRITQDSLRSEVESVLDELEHARQRVAEAAGDPVRLEDRLKELDETFERLTGTAPHRREGQTYAGRSLVYEDCQRGAEVDFGPHLLSRLGPPLTLVLESGRWLAAALAREVDGELRTLYRELRARGRSTAVDGHSFFMYASSKIFRAAERHGCFERVEREFQARWAELLGIEAEPSAPRIHRTVRDLGKRRGEAFGGGGEIWSLAQYFSPDLMIGAASEEAFRRGEYQLVLSEVHCSNSLSWSCFVSQHPAPDELFQALDADVGSRTVILPQATKGVWTQRMNVSLVLPRFYRFEYAEEPSPHPRCRSLRSAELLVEEVDGRLRARARDGEVEFAATELFGLNLTQECSRIMGRLLPPARHLPRVEIDDLVIFRERWQFLAHELEPVRHHEPLERFLAVRHWARSHDLPRFSFYKILSEPKPCFLDLDSPIYVDIFARLVRNAAAEETVVFTEMLPTIEQAWLTDAQGNRYTSELRIAALETAT